MESFFNVSSSLNSDRVFYYCYKSSGKYAFSSDKQREDPDLIVVPQPAINSYQIWDGEKWIGSEQDLHERYGSFRVAMLNSNGWQRIKGVGGDPVLSFIGAIAFMEEAPIHVKILWNRIIEYLGDTDNPTAAEIAQWQGMVIATEVGIAWIGDRNDAFDITDEGLMI